MNLFIAAGMAIIAATLAVAARTGRGSPPHPDRKDDPRRPGAGRRNKGKLVIYPGSPPEKKILALEAIAHWSGTKSTVIELEKLSKLWLDDPNAADAITASFENEDIINFYRRHVKGVSYYTGSPGKAVVKLLEILDKHGGCPSIVNRDGDTEYTRLKNQFDVLARVTLSRHVINVCEEALKTVGETPASVRVVLACLGHDLGKIPGFQSQAYSMGDHPSISVAIMKNIPEFTVLRYHESVLKAVANHHLDKSADILTKQLCDADNAARRLETGTAVAGMVNVDKVMSMPTMDQPLPARQNQPRPAPPPRPAPVSVGNQFTAAMGLDEKAESKPITEYALPWFDAGAFLSTLGPRINRPWMMNGKPIFKCFSMSDGAVYVWVDVVWETAAAMARQAGDPTLDLCGTDEREKRHGILLSVTRALRKHGAIIDSLMGDRFFKNDFDVVFKDGRTVPKRAMVPLKAEAFGIMVSELEAKKPDDLRLIAKVCRHQASV